MKYPELWPIGRALVLVVGFLAGVELGIAFHNPDLGFFVGVFPLLFLYLGVRRFVHGPDGVPRAMGALFAGFAVAAACAYIGQYWLLVVLGVAAFVYSRPARHIPGFRSAIGFVGALIATYGILKVTFQIPAVFWTSSEGI